MRVPINISPTPVFAIPCTHNSYAWPQPKAIPLLHLEIPWPQGGMGLASSRSSKVEHSGFGIVLSNHDMGNFLVHMALGAPNMLLPLHILGSSRKTMFSSSSVQIEGKTVACAWNVVLPMVLCGEPRSYPLGVPLNLHSVTVGFTAVDFMRGVLLFLRNLLFDDIFKNIAKGKPVERWRWANRGGAKLINKFVAKSNLTTRRVRLTAVQSFEKQIAGMIFGADSLSTAGVMRGLAKTILTANATSLAETIEYGEARTTFSAGKGQMKWSLSYSQSRGASLSFPFKAEKLFDSDDAKDASTKASREHLTPGGAGVGGGR